ncbi:MAG TPA: YncE family protein [Candidatus Methylomirabilis sp.]|nr:YncE family protein [Candidatus Methylomirabilis sp.]
MEISRRAMLKATAMGALALSAGGRLAAAQTSGASAIESNDRVFIANEDSNTISVIDPRSNSVETTINLTSFDEDPRPPFRFVTAGTMPTHAAMINKPLYHGAIAIHGVVPSPDGKLLATSGRGTSNVYLIDTVARRVVGNSPNPQAGATTNPERLTSGILVGREPHEPTFTRDGKEIWVAVRGEDRIAILDTQAAIKESGGIRAGAVREYLPTVNGPAQIWFSADGTLAFVISQKVARVDVFLVNRDAEGRSHPARKTTLDISAQDPPAFTPFQKTSPDGAELWLSHKLADRVSAVDTRDPYRALDAVSLGNLARPNHLEFIQNAAGKAIYVSLARVDDGGPGGVASSQIAIIDHSAPAGSRKVVGNFFTHGREAHGLWTNPSNTLLYVSHEQDELPGTPAAGQTVASAFDVSNPLAPVFVAQIPLGSLNLPSGQLRNKKSINLVYVRPGARGQTA